MKKNIVLATIALASSFAVFAHNKHVHGEGRLDAAIDNTTVSLELEVPLDAVVGFERPPRNDKEKAALTSAEKTLKDAVALWILTPAANCRFESAQVSLPKFEGEHADIDANYLFRCSNPRALKSIETSLFKSFKRLYRIEVQYIGPNGQGAARLSPNKPVLTW